MTLPEKDPFVCELLSCISKVTHVGSVERRVDLVGQK